MRYLTLILGLFICTVASAQTTQPAKLSDLWQPYADRMEARIAELPNVPTEAQIATAKADCAAIGDEFEAAVKLKYVSYDGFATEDGKSARWFSRRNASPREQAKGIHTRPRRPVDYTVTYSAPINAAHGTPVHLEGQVVQCAAEAFIKPDSITNGSTELSTTVGYPTLRVYLNAGNVITMAIP
jgi:hypothetical protein